MVPEQGTTSYLAPFPCDCQNRGEGREDEEGSERLGRLDPKIWAETSKFQDLVLCSSDCRTETRQNEPDGLVALQERLEDAASAVKATTTASRNRNQFSVPDEIREMAADAASCRDPVRRKLLRKRARKARREFEAGRAVFPRSKVIHRPVVTKLWINGRASEDRDEWTEEVRAHCEKRLS